jgi:hypothetical protein
LCRPAVALVPQVLASFMMLASVLVIACAVNDEELSAKLLSTVAERLVAR